MESIAIGRSCGYALAVEPISATLGQQKITQNSRSGFIQTEDSHLVDTETLRLRSTEMVLSGNRRRYGRRCFNGILESPESDPKDSPRGC
jgi:hypothetical protein